MDMLILKLTWKGKGPRIVNTIFKKKNKLRELPLFYFKTYYKAIIIKSRSYWHKDRHISSWFRRQSPEINQYIYGQFIFGKSAKTFHEEQVFQQMVLGQLDIHLQKNEVRSYRIPYTINPKWITDFNVRTKTLKRFEEHTEVHIFYFELVNGFLNMALKAYVQKKNQ